MMQPGLCLQKTQLGIYPSQAPSMRLDPHGTCTAEFHLRFLTWFRLR